MKKKKCHVCQLKQSLQIGLKISSTDVEPWKVSYKSLICQELKNGSLKHNKKLETLYMSMHAFSPKMIWI